jgi:hypothetical protein
MFIYYWKVVWTFFHLFYSKFYQLFELEAFPLFLCNLISGTDTAKLVSIMLVKLEFSSSKIIICFASENATPFPCKRLFCKNLLHDRKEVQKLC